MAGPPVRRSLRLGGHWAGGCAEWHRRAGGGQLCHALPGGPAAATSAAATAAAAPRRPGEADVGDPGGRPAAPKTLVRVHADEQVVPQQHARATHDAAAAAGATQPPHYSLGLTTTVPHLAATAARVAPTFWAWKEPLAANTRTNEAALAVLYSTGVTTLFDPDYRYAD